MILTPDSESLREFNPCHSPAGSPKGGQFCAKDGETVALHRGDNADVEPSLSHADPHALFGAGIYLTDSKRIAGDYTVKGAHDGVHFRYAGKAGSVSKDEVIKTYIRRVLYEHPESFRNRIASYGYAAPGTVPSLLSGPGTYVPQEVAQAERAAVAKWEEQAKTLDVRINADGTATIQQKAAKGRVATYSVPKSWLRKTIDAEAEIDEDVVDAIVDTLRAHGDRGTARDVAAFARQQDDGGFRPSFRDVFTSISGGPLRDDEGASVDLRRALKALGYKGIHYAGGATMGGGGNHNAYVFWDEQGLRKRRQRKLREGEVLLEANDCHTPAGSPNGGQFCAKGGASATAFERNPDESLKDALEYRSLGGHSLKAVFKAYGVNPSIVAVGDRKILSWEADGKSWAMDYDEDSTPYEASDYVYNASDLDLEEMFPTPEFWDDPSEGGYVYHATPEENAASIEKHGLNPMDETRGISNRWVGAAVFASTNPDAISSYGPVVFEIDLEAMRKDGDTPRVDKEGAHREAEQRAALARKLGIEDWYSDDAGWDGTSSEDRIIYGHIPAKYLRRMD